MGAGKSYYAKQASEWLNIGYLEGDLLVSGDMVECVSKFKPIERRMIQELVYNLKKTIIRIMPNEPRGLAVAQALYFDKDRLYLDRSLRDAGYHVWWMWVKPRFWENVRRLMKRPNRWRWIWYWLRNKRYFEPPTHGYSPVE